MLGNRPAQESELVGPICARFGLTVESSRLLISEGRKVGFVVDCGSLPLSVRCFVEEFPTPSTSLERNSSRGKALCFLPKGFKVVGLVEGSVYLGEVVYDENWKRSYKFHLVEGPEIVKSSMPCSNPTSAFKEIEAVIKVQTTKKRHRKPDARSNGKLYMAVMYSATQRLLREKFRGCESKVPEDVRPIFIEWLENRSSNKAFAAGSLDAAIVPLPQSLKPVMPVPLPRQTCAPVLARPPPAVNNASDGSGEGGTHSDNLHLMNLDDAQIDSFFSHPDQALELGHQNGASSVASGTRKRSSGSVDEYGHLLAYTATNTSSFEGIAGSRKRSSGSIDEQSPMLLTRKRASGSIDEDSAIFKDAEAAVHSTQQQSMAMPHSGLQGMNFGGPLVADAGELFADCFKLTEDAGDGAVDLNSALPIPSAPDHLTLPQISSSFSSPLLGFDDVKQLVNSGSSFENPITTSELCQYIRDPNKESLTAQQIRAAIATLLQLPVGSLPFKYIEEVAKMATKPNKNSFSFEEFLSCLERRERDIAEKYNQISAENNGVVTMEAMHAAGSKGLLSGIEFDMEDLQDRMDALNFTRTPRSNPAHPERRLSFDQFKALALPLPSSASIRSVVELVRNSLTDSMELDVFSF